MYTDCFICSDVTTSKQHVQVFKSGCKGTSFVDLHRPVCINKALDINVTVYSNLDVAVRVCITFSLKANAKKRIYLKNCLRKGWVKCSAKWCSSSFKISAATVKKWQLSNYVWIYSWRRCKQQLKFQVSSFKFIKFSNKLLTMNTACK